MNGKTDESAGPERGHDGGFLTTRWSRVLEAQGDSRDSATALSELCASYYSPIESYIARTSHDLGDARDLTHDFFARLLSGRIVRNAKPDKGRFRSYLLGAAKHFLANERERQAAAKRGAQFTRVPLAIHDTASPPGELQCQGADPSETQFDREWGLAVLSRALAKLAAEHAAQGKSAQFELLKNWLTGDPDDAAFHQAMEQMHATAGALKVAIHRLRRRFRECVKNEISQTVSDEKETRDELRYLIDVVT